MAINDFTRQSVRRRAKFLCEYCHSLERTSATPFTIDHLIPQSLGGSDEINNLAYACQRCNFYRYNFTTGIDPDTNQEVPLFNPRTQDWEKHFIWTADGLRILGVTPIGRATCKRLDLNDDDHNQGFIQNSRQSWVEVGWHPPQGDPKLLS
ncbi:HNH endonuclease signature motif containing protein [Leptolyngbya boryana CZ1]|uniref:HNH endonuclease signature motif containing protein n=1 Tax=Leptolyngbya boryana CZ1 TaxID=3060204 RepID=A0AA97AWC6_LEPBY|nr:HNH endonuclease signature motif containing protein [Leptolyngbya boryana]WNZ48190.1 HNH endonuclease signature motif containing protein [Leptolyngbya boryana CZ1]